MGNSINSGSLNTLKLGDTLLLTARKVKGDKISLEFAEVLKVQEGPVTAVSRFNRSDSRFGNRARRAWVNVTVEDVSADLGMDFSDNNPEWEMTPRGEMLELNMLNPTVEGERIRVAVNETTEPDAYQADHIETAAKRKGKDGEFIKHNGEYIFSNTLVVITNDVVEHTLLEADVEKARVIKDVIAEKSMVTDEYGI
tara:strand:- start:556 stop:1146 length:591 start_codon:yes stop_codon:yes gene_type:complete